MMQVIVFYCNTDIGPAITNQSVVKLSRVNIIELLIFHSDNTVNIPNGKYSV